MMSHGKTLEMVYRDLRVFPRHLLPGKTPQNPVNLLWGSLQGFFSWDVIDGYPSVHVYSSD